MLTISEETLNSMSRASVVVVFNLGESNKLQIVDKIKL